MNLVRANIKEQLYKTVLKTATNTIVSDEPAIIGGQDLGFTPTQLFAASLAACTAMTVRMYADRKSWKLDFVNVDIDFDRNLNSKTVILTKNIEIHGDLDDEQRKRLLMIAKKCPIQKVLENTIEIKSHLT